MSLVVFAGKAFAADITWNSADAGIWNDDTNWAGGSKPGADDTAIFDGTGAGVCTVDTDEVCTGITLSSGTISVTTGSLDLSGDFTISGGSFTAPNAADKFYVGGTWTNNGGTFNNGGTSAEVTLDGASKNITGTATTTFNDLTIDGTYTFQPLASVTMTVVGTLLTNDSGDTLTLDADTGNIDLVLEAGAYVNNGNIEIISSTDDNVTIQGTDSTVRDFGEDSGDNFIDLNAHGVYLRYLDFKMNAVLDEAGDAIIVTGPCTFVNVSITKSLVSFEVSNDAVATVNGDVTIGTGSISAWFLVGDTNTASSGTVNVSGDISVNTSGFWASGLHVSEDNSTITANNINVTGQSFFVLTEGYTNTKIDVSGNITVSGGNVNFVNHGTIELEGNWDSSGTAVFSSGSSSTITLDGSTSSSTFTAKAGDTYNNITVNKTSGTDALDNVTFQTNAFTIDGTLTVTDGEAVQQVPFTRVDAVDLANAGKWTNTTASADITLGGNVTGYGSGHLNFDAAFNIRASETTQRDWAGGFTVDAMSNVDVSYQNCTTDTITVTSGTDSGNNTNWVFGTTEISGTAYTDDTKVSTQNSAAVTVVVYDDSAGT